MFTRIESEDLKELVQTAIDSEIREKELVEVIKDLRKAYLTLGEKYGEEVNSNSAYLKSLKY